MFKDTFGGQYWTPCSAEKFSSILFMERQITTVASKHLKLKTLQQYRLFRGLSSTCSGTWSGLDERHLWSGLGVGVLEIPQEEVEEAALASAPTAANTNVKWTNQFELIKKEFYLFSSLHFEKFFFCRSAWMCVFVYLWREVAEHQPAGFSRAAVTPGRACTEKKPRRKVVLVTGVIHGVSLYFSSQFLKINDE